MTVTAAAFPSLAPPQATEAATTNASNNSVVQSELPGTGQNVAAALRPASAASSAAPRREVLNAMQALREMPPFAREREIDYGRYSHFSPEERELLRKLEK